LFGFDVMTDGWGPWEQLAAGMAEAGETLLVMRLLPYMEYMLEVGAGNGYFSFIAAQNGAAVTALEPSPLEHKQLRAGIAVNGFTNVAAPVCSAGESAAGGVLYLEGGPTLNALTLADYRATGSLVRLAAPECSLPLLSGAKDWLGAYDAPVLLMAAGREAGAGGQGKKVLAAVNELTGYDYSLFAVSRRPEHDAPLLAPLAGDPGRAAACFLGLPPMAHDLAEPLTKRVDLRVFMPTAKLENLYYFVKNSFEEL
jgi:SAM-dependent methyltransferase